MLHAGHGTIRTQLLLPVAARDGDQDQQGDGRCLFKIILALIEATKDPLSLYLQGSTSLRQRVCCQLVRQIAPMKDVAALETPQEKVVNL